MNRSLALQRLRKSMRRHLGAGWVRAVFARPQEGDGPADEDVVERPAGTPTEAELEAIFERAVDAARRGCVRQTFVIDERTRVRIDARHGRARVLTSDEGTLEKQMGGKARALRPDRSAALLRHIGIMNPDGSISAKHAKKYKQVSHFVELCRPTWTRLVQARTVDPEHPLVVVDLGCGNSVLTFVLAEALRLEGIPARFLGVDRRADVIERSRARARALGWDWLTFEVGDIERVDREPRPDLVVALHACDTATDDALAFAIRRAVPAIFCAPCCQHELAQQLETAPVAAIAAHGLLRQDYAAVLTDALRVELLEAVGYKVDVVEFVTAEHSAKNLLLRAHDRGQHRDDITRLAAIAARCRALGVAPKLLRTLTHASSC